MSGEQTASVTHRAAASPGVIFCEVLSGKGVSARHVLGDSALVVGSSEEADIRIADVTLSRRHASVEATPRGVRVEDLGSRNGTWYLGAGIREALVPLGATVRVGKTLLRFSGADAESQGPIIEGLLGNSPAMVQLRAQLARVAKADVAVLLRGETGTGKEAAARALHQSGPFVTFEGGHAGGELVDSQLFGHQKGAFTGASQSRAGALEQADGGTLFLDEVGELDPNVQVRLLRVLETRRFTRLGGGEARTSSFRLVSSTQHDLEQRVRERTFREDLFFRLAVVVIDVPPLRLRTGDVRLLAEHFAAERGVNLDGVTLAAWERAPWPGNVRELKNAVERYRTGVGAGTVEAPAAAREQVLSDVEKSLLAAALDEHGWDVAKAARRLGLSRSQVYRQMQRHGLEPKRKGGRAKGD
ncbi:MAG: sigma 54-dependent Fis family transcriptional regulator [Myxococcaceae bacterium]|nr:sigma 54-dependent Fis family transcriptional regulator [Myxococcaceae bacterium]